MNTQTSVMWGSKQITKSVFLKLLGAMGGWVNMMLWPSCQAYRTAEGTFFVGTLTKEFWRLLI